MERKKERKKKNVPIIIVYVCQIVNLVKPEGAMIQLYLFICLHEDYRMINTAHKLTERTIYCCITMHVMPNKTTECSDT